MSETSSDAFLSGQSIPVDPHDIETELTRLWGPAAERAGGTLPGEPERDADRPGQPRRRRAGWPTPPGSTACSTP